MKIVITGGSRGIGKVLTEHLSKKHEVIIISKNIKSLDKTKKELGIKGYCTDVSKIDGIKEIFNDIENFDALINCAGILGPVGFLVDNDQDQWIKTINVNLIGTVNACKAAVQFLSDNGKIINISGGGSAYPRIYHTAYACSKIAVVRFTEILAKEFEEEKINIKINVIAPGAHKTDMWNDETFDEHPTNWADKENLFSMVDFLLDNNKINGRFIHIKDDKEKLLLNQNNDMFTLRRIDEFKFEPVK